MRYSINVAKNNGRKLFGNDEPAFTHLFKAELGNVFEADAKSIRDDMRNRYPYPEFKVDLTRWEEYGYFID